MDYLSRNKAAYDRLAKQGSVFAKCATDEECQRPLATLDSRGWLPRSVIGLKVLCLAAGGGWQSILYAAAGADVTVVDLSPEMLALDHREAKSRGYSLRLLETSMDDLHELPDDFFDIVHHPVSTCYVPKVAPVFAEVSRVLKQNGIYISQHKQPISLQITQRDSRDRYIIGIEYYREGPLPHVEDQSYREPGALEFLHRTEEILGGICEAGMVIEAFSEPKRAKKNATPGDFRHRGNYVSPYYRIKARKVDREKEDTPASPNIWTP